jgi:DNA-binding transcriptional MerR regulator
MLTFYGLKWSDNKKSSEVGTFPMKTSLLMPLRRTDYFQITLGINFDEAKENWVRRYDHNHLRITRIIRSLRVLGLEEEALAFYRALEKVQSESAAISARSLTYWRRAAFRPLHIQPSVDEGREEDVRGPAFLREYEELKHMELKGDMTADGTSPAGLKGQADRANHEQANEAQMANSTDIGHPSPKSPRDEIAKEADSGSSEDEMVRWRTGDTKN